jgi:hypothetical protein
MSSQNESGQPEEEVSPRLPSGSIDENRSEPFLSDAEGRSVSPPGGSQDPDSEPEPPVDLAAVAARIALGAVVGVLLLLHALLLRHSGAFWRDECSSIFLAQAPSWSEMWHHLAMDSFPGLFVSILRAWIQGGLGASDFGIRLLGILISLGMLFSVFLSCRAMNVRFPILALCLVGLNADVFYVGCSIRAYGLAALLIVACFAAFWRVAVQPTRWNVGSAFLLAVLSVHCNYQNSYLLFGIGMAAALVAAVERRWMRSAMILAMCFLAALSLLIYLPIIAHYRDELIVSKYELSVTVIVSKLIATLAASGPWVVFAWIAGLFALVYHVVQHFCLLYAASVARLPTADTASLEATPDSGEPLSGPEPLPCADLPVVAEPTAADLPAIAEPETPAEPAGAEEPAEPSPGLYCLLTIIIAGVTGATFFKIAAMYPFPWHYVPFVTLCAVAIECGIACCRPGSRLWFGKIVLTCYVAICSLPAAWNIAHLRRTNIDQVARELEQRAQAKDLVLVSPFWLRPSFQKYYHGPAPWRILPVDPDDPTDVWFGYALSLKNIMVKPNSIQPTLDLVQKTLQGGGRIWIVGYIPQLSEGERPPELLPAPHPVYGWNNNEYSEVWAQHLSYFLKAHAKPPERFIIPSNQPIDIVKENLPFEVFHGWRNK